MSTWNGRISMAVSTVLITTSGRSGLCGYRADLENVRRARATAHRPFWMNP
jgi:hypothetical protein